MPVQRDPSIDAEPTLRGTPAQIANALIASMGTFDDEPRPWPRSCPWCGDDGCDENGEH